jgi:hypothetical protein
VRLAVPLLAAAAITASVWADVVAPAESAAQRQESMRELRRQAAHRQRRIIFNNDGDDIVYELKEATPQALLDARTTGLLGTQVDSIFYCTWCSGFGLCTHKSPVAEPFIATTGVFTPNKTKEFHDKGLDPLTIMVEFAKRNGLEIFWSMRMNDYHDGDYQDYPEMFPKFKKDHPQYLFGTPENRPTGIADGRVWAGVDYGRTEVRERAYRLIEDVCQRYDVDGIEMDFFRHLVFFRKHAWGEPCGDEERAMMTGLLRRIRRMTEEVAIRRGRPLLVAVRVPDSMGYCRGIGLDIERWLREDLVDIMTVGGYFRLSPWETSAQLGHKYGVPVYASLDDSRMRDDEGKVRDSPECYRARAMEAWLAGVDGIYMFNAFNPKSPLWRELGDPKTLSALDKVYMPVVRSLWGVGGYLRGGQQFLARPVLCPERPVTLRPGEPHVVTFPVGDDLPEQEAEGLAPAATLRLRVEGLATPDDLVVMLNGPALTGGSLNHGWLEFALTPGQVRRGRNRCEMALGAGVQEQPVLRDLQLVVDYPHSP